MKETLEKLHKTSRFIISRIKYGASSTKAGIKYLFIVPRFHGDDVWIPAYETVS